MDGLSLSRRYYEQYGRPLLKERFPSVNDQLAVGLAGAGSECMGYDDAVSEDHDFGPGFCIWLPGEEIVDRRTAFLLERAYASLPMEFEGRRRSQMAPVGGARTGVMRMADFFSGKCGDPEGRLTLEQWLNVPTASLAEAVNGEIFSDPSGIFTQIRESLWHMPRDARLKRMAGHLLLMAQSGQYNYQRCLDHGETGAAQLAAYEYVRHAISVIFLLNDKYEPFYKWAFRAIRDLQILPRLEKSLTDIISTPNDPESSFEKYTLIEETASAIIEALIDLGFTKASCRDLEKHAYSVNDAISDGSLRNMHILCCAGVS